MIGEHTTYVYVIGHRDGPVKVGVSAFPNGRLAQLQTGCPFPLRLLHQVAMRDRSHALKHEALFRDAWEHKRTVGEWFDLSCDAAIESLGILLQRERDFA